MTLIPNNDRVPVQKLGDPLLVGETYPNAGSQYKVLKVEGYYGDAWVQNVKSGWVCKIHHPALYLMPGGQIELKWDCSTEEHFEKTLELCCKVTILDVTTAETALRGRRAGATAPCLKMAGQR